MVVGVGGRLPQTDTSPAEKKISFRYFEYSFFQSHDYECVCAAFALVDAGYSHLIFMWNARYFHRGIYCSSQPSMVHRLSISIFPCLFVVRRPAMVTSDQIFIFTGISALY